MKISYPFSTTLHVSTQIPSSAAEIENWLMDKFAEQLSISAEEIDANAEFISFGMDSMDAIMISGDLEDWLQIELPSTLLWDYPNISLVSEYLFQMVSGVAIAS